MTTRQSKTTQPTGAQIESKRKSAIFLMTVAMYITTFGPQKIFKKYFKKI
jgi:hypothetical protein